MRSDHEGRRAQLDRARRKRNLLPGLQLVNTRNRGVAFGFLPGSHVAVSVLVGLALIVLLAYFARNSSKPLIWLPTGLLLGGALGNILDRLRDGSVTDFIKLPLGWPPFNLADAAITIGSCCCCSSSRASDDPSELRVHDRLRRTSTCWSSTSPPAWSSIPRAAIARARSRSCSLTVSRAARWGRSRAAGNRPPPGPRHLRSARRGSLRGGPPPAAGGARAAADRARVPRARARAARPPDPARSKRPIGRDPRDAHAHGRGRRPARARRARTSRSSARCADASLLRLRLETGRTHQIRVHLQAIGHPVCGDPEYGTPGLLGLSRQFLHATRLAFAHPLTRRAARCALAAARRPARRARASRAVPRG